MLFRNPSLNTAPRSSAGFKGLDSGPVAASPSLSITRLPFLMKMPKTLPREASISRFEPRIRARSSMPVVS